MATARKKPAARKKRDPETIRETRRTQATSLVPKKQHPKATVRQLIVRFAHWGAAHQKEIHYGEVRPIPKVRKGVLPKLPFRTDCSGFSTMCFQWAGAPDPNGTKYNGQGYTGTLLGHLKHIPLVDVKPGDLVVYGTRSIHTGHHVAVVVDKKGNRYDQVVTISHGNEDGPYLISVTDEAKYQPDGLGGVVFLDAGVN